MVITRTISDLKVVFTAPMTDILVLGLGCRDHNQKYIYWSKSILFTTEYQVAVGRSSEFFQNGSFKPTALYQVGKLISLLRWARRRPLLKLCNLLPNDHCFILATTNNRMKKKMEKMDHSNIFNHVHHLKCKNRTMQRRPELPVWIIQRRSAMWS